MYVQGFTHGQFRMSSLQYILECINILLTTQDRLFQNVLYKPNKYSSYVLRHIFHICKDVMSEGMDLNNLMKTKG